MKEKWFQLLLPGYVQRVGFCAFLIHLSTLSEVVICATSQEQQIDLANQNVTTVAVLRYLDKVFVL